MTTYYLCPIATILQYFSDAGIVLNGGKVSTYLAGSSTPQATKTDNTGAVDNANPIVLNSAGRLPNVSMWQAQGIKLKIIITDANNNQIGSPIDQVAGIDDPTDLLATLASNSTGSGADLIANAVRSFDLISTVRAAGAPTLVAGQTRVIDVQAATTPGDGYGGLFYWDASSSATDDSLTIIKPTGVSGAGRYLRQRGNSVWALKSNNSSYLSTTLASDPDLTVTLPSGIYAFECYLGFNGTGGGAQGIKIQITQTGAGTYGFGIPVFGNVNAANYSNLLTVNTTTLAIATITANPGNDALFIKGVLFSQGSTVTLKFAQNSASANAVLVGGGSYILCQLKV